MTACHRVLNLHFRESFRKMYRGTQNQLLRSRQNSRLRDIAESQSLLLELVTSEPTILQCFRIVEATCLSQGIFCRIEGSEVSKPFQRFLDDHYLPFCKAAIRAMYTYGFVPWRVRRLGKGDEVPEVLAPGTFSWHTEVGPEEQERNPSRYYGGSSAAHPSFARRKKHTMPLEAHPDDDDSRLVIYRVTPTAGGVREEDVSIFISTPPALDVSVNSNIHATVPSPLAYLLNDYKNLREAQRRRSHADAWNTTARILSTFKPSLRTEDNPTQYLMDFVHEDHYAPPAIGDRIFPHFHAHNVWQREHVMRRQFMETPSTHHPEVYALPRDHDIVAQPNLQPCEDLTFLLEKYRRDVCALTGVPQEMIIGRDNGTPETVRKTLSAGRIFSTNMHEICRHLQSLLTAVYTRIYGARQPGAVQFIMIPMPRLEVETIQDFKILHEIGALSPDMTVKLSRILLGEEPSTQGRNSKRPRNNMNNNNNNPGPIENGEAPVQPEGFRGGDEGSGSKPPSSTGKTASGASKRPGKS